MNLQEYLDKAYQAIYQCLPEALPEFEFVSMPEDNGYQSSNSQKIDGSTGKRKGVVYVYANSYFGLKDYTRGFISIYNYLQQRDGLEHWGVLQLIAQLSGIPLPQQTQNLEENEAYRESLGAAEILEAANTFFIDCLSHSDNSYAKSLQAQEIRNYLVQQRGYHVGHFRLPGNHFSRYGSKMELGYFAGLAPLQEHLKNLGFSDSAIAKHIRISKFTEQNHWLSIPYRNKHGHIKGFAFRAVRPLDNSPKYLYSNGLERGTILFGLRSHEKIKDLVLVEGVLDALNAAANGIQHTVAVGGSELTKNQLQELLLADPQRITLCFDADQAGQIGTKNALQKLLPHSNEVRIFVAQLPSPIKDLDELIREKGVESAHKMIQEAISLARYLSTELLEDFIEKQAAGKQAPDKAVEELLLDAAKMEAQLQNPLDANLFRSLTLEVLHPYTVTADILAQKVGKLQEESLLKEYQQNLLALVEKITSTLQKGHLETAENLFVEEFRKLKAQGNVPNFKNLEQGQTEAALKEALLTAPEGINSGYSVQLADELIPVLLPAGAISFFCAPTSHGKTTMLINLMLNVAQQYPTHQIHLFSYEEAKEAITLKALNAFADLDLSPQNNLRALEGYFRTGSFGPLETKVFKEFQDKKTSFFEQLLSNNRIHIHYVDYDSAELIEAIHYLNQKNSAHIVFIDYMQLLQLGEQSKGRLSRQEELKRICLDLKNCAVETGLPLVLGAQFNREVVNPFRLHATKIGEAGDIERIASVVVGMWNNDFEPLSLLAEEELRLDEVYQPNTVLIKLLKNRAGKVGGQALLPYNGNRGKIYPHSTIKSVAYPKTNLIKF